jgi:hypothetical protein
MKLVKRGKDENGTFMTNGYSKHYYTPGNLTERSDARYACETEKNGDGIKDVFKKVVKGVKYVSNKLLDAYLTTMPKNLKDFLQHHGNEKLTHLVIARAPINSAIKKVVDLASNGQLEKNKSFLKYDNIYHLQVVINAQWLLEKNQIIEVKQFGAFPANTQVEKVHIHSIDSNLTLSIDDFITNAVKKTGNTIFRYNPQGSNCQSFVMSLLDGNHMNNPILTKFILQDETKLLRNVPDLSAITDMGALYSRLILGKGE